MPDWVVPTIWAVLGVILLTLLLLGASLLIKTDPFSGGDLSDDENKSLWAFLGVALGAAVTLIGTLLADQNNRRTAALAREAAEREEVGKRREEALKVDAEKRLKLDTVVKTLELISADDPSSSKARNAGAIATMTQLHGGPVALRVLAELWADQKVDTDTAIWLIDRILEDPESAGSEVEAACYLLARKADRLIPARGDQTQDWNEWPTTLTNSWPSRLSRSAKVSILVAVVNVLLARGPDYWRDYSPAVVATALKGLLDDGDGQISDAAAAILRALRDVGMLRVVAGGELAEATEEKVKSLSPKYKLSPWFGKRVGQFEQWARGEDIGKVTTPPSATVGTFTP
ncbi:MAG: hypothetical protein ACM30G_03145 [Micromonosporaceae bacterium]